MAQSTLKKSAYAAVGVPVQLMTNLRERLDAAKTAFDEMRDRVADEAAQTFDEWASEGEKLVTSIEERFTDTRQTVVENAATVTDVGKGLSETLTEPIIPIDEVDGIGPSYAAKLAKAGVVSTAALVERCKTQASLKRLADQSGIGDKRLEKWAESADLTRVKGVGDDYMTMLNGIGIGTLADLAASKPADLHNKATELAEKGRDSFPVPSVDTLRGWIAAAKKLS